MLRGHSGTLAQASSLGPGAHLLAVPSEEPGGERLTALTSGGGLAEPHPVLFDLG